MIGSLRGTVLERSVDGEVLLGTVTIAGTVSDDTDIVSGSLTIDGVEVASIAGVRPNQLIGYGLVVGLDGTGDQTTQTPFTTQSLANMLQQMGITLPAGVNPQLKNVAAVMVTASRLLQENTMEYMICFREPASEFGKRDTAIIGSTGP